MNRNNRTSSMISYGVSLTNYVRRTIDFVAAPLLAIFGFKSNNSNLFRPDQGGTILLAENKGLDLTGISLKEGEGGYIYIYPPPHPLFKSAEPRNSRTESRPSRPSPLWPAPWLGLSRGPHQAATIDAARHRTRDPTPKLFSPGSKKVFDGHDVHYANVEPPGEGSAMGGGAEVTLGMRDRTLAVVEKTGDKERVLYRVKDGATLAALESAPDAVRFLADRHPELEQQFEDGAELPAPPTLEAFTHPDGSGPMRVFVDVDTTMNWRAAMERRRDVDYVWREANWPNRSRWEFWISAYEVGNK